MSMVPLGLKQYVLEFFIKDMTKNICKFNYVCLAKIFLVLQVKSPCFVCAGKVGHILYFFDTLMKFSLSPITTK